MTNHAAQLAIIKHVTRQESRSSAGNCQADEQTRITQLSRPGSRDVCVCVYSIIFVIICLILFVLNICLGLVFCFLFCFLVFVLILFNSITGQCIPSQCIVLMLVFREGKWQPTPVLLPRKSYQRTNPREYQIVRTHTKETT